MPKSFALLVDETEAELQDSGNTLWTAAELAIQLEDALREISEYDPYITREIFEFETRTGTATATTAGSLVDTDESQFLATDVNKVIFNTTDRTWAKVITFTSTSVLVLSNDIMASGEGYKIYNRECSNIKQLYLGDVEDYVGPNHGVPLVEGVEFPIDSDPPRYRNFTVKGNVLTVDLQRSIADSKDGDAIVEVYVEFRRKHQVSQLTDVAGAVDLGAGYAAGLSTIHVDELGSAEVIAEDTEFTIAGTRGVYRTTQATTLSSNEGDITFWPPLLEAIADGEVVTFRESTLSRKLERQVVEFAAGRAAISKGALLLQQANDAITQTDLANVEVDLAKTALAAGYSLLNTVTKGGPNVMSDYSTQARSNIAVAAGYESVAQTYAGIVAGANSFRAWGESKIARVLQQLVGSLPPKQSFRYSRN